MLIAGAGTSGIAAARLLLSMEGEVVLYDGNTELDPDILKSNFEEEASVSVLLGNLKRTDLLGVEMCVINPGISLETPFIDVLDEARTPIRSGIQLAYQCVKGKLAAITGTSGGTTATAPVGEIMKARYKNIFTVGDIGTPYTQMALETEDDSTTMAEVSNFQLGTIMDFRSDVSAILNITSDYLNQHHTVECYIEVKESVTRNQTEADTCVLNYDDEVLREFGESERLKAKPMFFNNRQELEEGYYLGGDLVVYRHEGRTLPVIDVHKLRLLGRHNFENVMAAVAVSMTMSMPLEKIQGVLRTFTAVEHRIGFMPEHAGVRCYNDSKRTSPDAAIQVINAMPGPILLIAGGYDKQSEYDEWVEALEGKMKYLVLIGQTGDKIAECAKTRGFTKIMYAEDMPEAVHVCVSYANMEDCVLLSPACASWGVFKNYEERGDISKEYVRNLQLKSGMIEVITVSKGDCWIGKEEKSATIL